MTSAEHDADNIFMSDWMDYDSMNMDAFYAQWDLFKLELSWKHNPNEPLVDSSM
jgi:hypothetical protein